MFLLRNNCFFCPQLCSPCKCIFWCKWLTLIFIQSSPTEIICRYLQNNLDSSFSGHTIVWDQYSFGTSSIFFFFWSKQWKWRYIDFKLLHNYWDQVVGLLNTNVTWNGPFKHMEYFSSPPSLFYSIFALPNSRFCFTTVLDKIINHVK